MAQAVRLDVLVIRHPRDSFHGVERVVEGFLSGPLRLADRPEVVMAGAAAMAFGDPRA